MDRGRVQSMLMGSQARGGTFMTTRVSDWIQERRKLKFLVDLSKLKRPNF